jgi:glycosyltransferase involved in cell wall biosynthesis
MKILMLDKSHITDRRIVLEAEALIAKGHEVILCSGRENLQQKPLEIDKHLKIYRFFSRHLLEYCLEQISTEELNQLNQTLGQYKIREKSRVKAYLKFAFAHPYWMLIQFNRMNVRLPDFFHKSMEFFLACLSNRKDLIQSSLKSKKNDWQNIIEKYVVIDFKPDVIHAHDYSSLETGLALSQKYRIPLIYDAHELYSYQPGIPKAVAKTILKNEKKLIQHVHTCITVNQQQADIMANDFDFHQFLPITNATVEPNDFNPNHHYDLIRQVTHIPKDEGIMLFQGGINRLRKIDLLLEGLALVKQKIHLVFLTFGNEINEFKAMANDLGIADRVHFLPVVPWEDMVFWAASADVGVLPYQADDMNTKISSPNKMYEFICSATPMIASSELINVHEVLTKENFGVSYRLKDVKDYARAIEIMFDEKLGGPKRFKADLLAKRHHYLWSHEAKLLTDFYAKLAKERGFAPQKNQAVAEVN